MILQNRKDYSDISYIKAYGKGCKIDDTYMIKDDTNEEIIGIVEYIKSKNEDSIYLYYIYIAPRFRRKHIASEVINMIKENNIIYGCSIQSNDAISFWTSMYAEFDEDLNTIEYMSDYYTLPFTIY